LYLAIEQFLLISAFFGFNSTGNANQENEMNQKKFDYSSYGFVNKDELSITLHLWKGANLPPIALKPKTRRSSGIHMQEKLMNPQDISAALEFTNVSSRELHIENRLWFTKLKVFANDKPLKYMGPMVSMPPPERSDFVTLKPGDKFATEPAILNGYYGLPDDFTGSLKVSFQFSSEAPVVVSTLSADH
jgi:hypothetical protein